jgi:16S rRNA (uracil1498-N3)-methyltransferase
MNLFFAPDIENELCYLSAEEARHCIQVLRYGTGQSVWLTDGKGFIYEGRIERIGRKEVQVRITSKTLKGNGRDYYLHLAVAPTKNIDRYEWFLEKATEIGVDEITPLYLHNSERRQIRSDRLEKILISSMKQSLKAVKPVLNEGIALNDFFSISRNNTQLFIAYCGNRKKQLLSKAYRTGQDAIILIGPEGDFTEEEVTVARKSDYQVVSLGDSRLRTETAALAACHTIYLLNQLTE